MRRSATFGYLSMILFLVCPAGNRLVAGSTSARQCFTMFT